MKIARRIDNSDLLPVYTSFDDLVYDVEVKTLKRVLEIMHETDERIGIDSQCGFAIEEIKKEFNIESEE